MSYTGCEMIVPRQATELTKKEISAMREFKAVVARGHSMGRSRILSMQALERAGLVQRITHNGIIADWRLTSAGEKWNENSGDGPT